MEKLALFDFDGTITKKDSFISFIRYSCGNFKTLFGFTFLSPVLVLYKLKIIPNYKAKEIVLSYFFKGMNKENFKKISKNYSLNYLDSIIRKKALDRLNWHKKEGHKVIVVSASIEEWLKPWCLKNDLDLIATKLEIKNNMIGGKLSTKNCYGIEKVNRLKEEYDLSTYDYIYAYGDSSGDSELLALANESFYKPFQN